MSGWACADRLGPRIAHASGLRCAVFGIAALLITPPMPTLGQSRPSGAITDRDRAADDSLERLFAEAGDFKLASGQELRHVLARSADDELAVRLAIREACQSWRSWRHPRGLLELDAWMPISALDGTLATVIQRRFENVDGLLPMAITWARSNPPAILATGQYLPSSGLVNEHPGWRHCSPWQMALAARAAAADARAAMLVRLGYCRTSDGQELGFILHREKKLRAAISSLLNYAPVAEPMFERTGVCRVAMTLTRLELVTLLREASRAVEGFGGRGLLGLGDPPTPDDLAAEGYAVAPPLPNIHQPPLKKRTEPPPPEWAHRFLVVQGAGRAPSDTIDEASRDEWAERAARIEAYRQLWRQIEDLPLDDGETIGLRMHKDPKLISELSSLGRFMADTGKPLHANDGAITISTGVHLQIVWRMLSASDQAR